MGIKDWFGGDKKKAAYREKVREAISDGKLSKTDFHNLKELRDQLQVTDAADDKTVHRRDLYNEAVGAARNKGEISKTGVHELAKIQKFLALRDDQIENTKRDVARLRVLTDIRRGNLPIVPPANIALRGMPMEPGEIAHYTMTVDVLDQPSLKGKEGLQIVWGAGYPGGVAMHSIPDEGAKEVSESALVLTNRRLVLKTGTRVAAVKLAREAQIFLYADGIRLPRTVGNTLLKFRSRSDETAEIVGELLGVLMRPEVPKPDDDDAA